MRAGLILALGGGLALAGAVLAQEAPAPAAAAAEVTPIDVSKGDRTAGRKLAGQCRTCHGLDGFAQIPIAPHIGGEPASYLAAQLAAFRDGRREHEMMSIVARTLSDQQIADLAAWFSGHRIAATPTADLAGAPVNCTGCHGEDGLHLFEDAPNLAGEVNIYIDTQLKAFRSGQRTHPLMSEIAAHMTDAEIRAAADWYASVRVKIEQVD